jgi:hypothetical protein
VYVDDMVIEGACGEEVYSVGVYADDVHAEDMYGVAVCGGVMDKHVNVWVSFHEKSNNPVYITRWVVQLIIDISDICAHIEVRT